MSFICSRTPSRTRCITFSCHVSLGFSWLWHFLKLSLFWVTLTVLRVLVKYLVKGLPIEIILMLFSWWETQTVGFGEKDHRGQGPLSPPCIRVPAVNMTDRRRCCLCSSFWVGLCRVFRKVALPHPFHIVLFLCSPHLKGGPVHVAPLESRILT